MKFTHFWAALCALGFILAGCAEKPQEITPEPDITAQADVVYYLVRHAEKVLDVKDPPLTPEGQKRAEDLAARLSGVELDKIYSTDTLRTRDTAMPTVSAKGLPLTIYDGGELLDFSAELSAEKGHILIVGHSNTTPVLVSLLDGEAGLPIDEATEYDRFYIVARKGDETKTKLERYGH
ncbi:MAG: histidine phosphatase family protein [Maricaulaceae bacterium]